MNANEQFPALPAPMEAANMAALRPAIVIDSREQAPLAFHRLPSVVDTLTSGDYSVRGLEHLFAVERKSIADLVACCMGDNRERFERELHRLRGFRCKRLLIVGTKADVIAHRYRSNLAPKAVLSTVAAFEVRYDCPVVWAATPDDAAKLVEGWAYWYSREVLKSAASLWRAATEQEAQQGNEAL